MKETEIISVRFNRGTKKKIEKVIDYFWHGRKSISDYIGEMVDSELNMDLKVMNDNKITKRRKA